MNAYPIIGMAVIAMLITLCDRPSKSTELKVYHHGYAFEIIERSDQGDAAHFIRYRSEDPIDESVRREEQKDILAIVAKHIDTNKHQRIIITAVEKRGMVWSG